MWYNSKNRLFQSIVNEKKILVENKFLLGFFLGFIRLLPLVCGMQQTYQGIAF